MTIDELQRLGLESGRLSAARRGRRSWRYGTPEVKLPRFRGHLSSWGSPKEYPRSEARPPYAAEFRQQMVDLVRDVRRRTWLASSSRRAIRTWVAQAGRDRAAGCARRSVKSFDAPRTGACAKSERSKGAALVRAGGPTRETYRVMRRIRLVSVSPRWPGCSVSPRAGTTRGVVVLRRLGHGPMPSSGLASRRFTCRSRGTYGAPRMSRRTDRGRCRGEPQAGRPGHAVRRRRRGEPAPRPSHDTPECPGPPGPGSGRGRFEADAPNRLWVADITYVPTLAGFLYLAIVLDVFSRRVVGWAMAGHLRTALVVEALEMAVTQRRPEAVDPSLRPRLPVHLAGLRRSLPGTGRRAIDGFGRRLLRQCDGRELLRDPGVRAARPNDAVNARRSTGGVVRVHRGVVQHAAASLRARLPVATGASNGSIRPALWTVPGLGRPTGAHKSVGSRAAHGIHTAHRNQCYVHTMT